MFVLITHICLWFLVGFSSCYEYVVSLQVKFTASHQAKLLKFEEFAATLSTSNKWMAIVYDSGGVAQEWVVGFVGGIVETMASKFLSKLTVQHVGEDKGGESVEEPVGRLRVFHKIVSQKADASGLREDCTFAHALLSPSEVVLLIWLRLHEFNYGRGNDSGYGCNLGYAY